MGFGWKDALEIGMGVGIGFLTGGPAGAVLGGATSARREILEHVGQNAQDEYQMLLDYLRELADKDITNDVRRELGFARIRGVFEEGGNPYEERHVRATLENALLDIKGDLAEAFDPGRKKA